MVGAIGKKVKERREELGLSQAELATRVGLTQQAIAEIEAGRSRSSLKLFEIAEVLGRPAAWFKGDERRGAEDRRGVSGSYRKRTEVAPIKVDDFTPIGRFDTSFSMGPGALVAEHPAPLGFWLVETQWLRAITSTAPENLAIVKVTGDSMTPTLHDGDWVLVDKLQTRISREGIYAIRVVNDAWVKRLSLNLRDKTVRIISDNTTIPVQDIEETELFVIGRVVSLVARRVP